MDYNQVLDGVCQIGYRLLSSGAEIYRVEDTVQRLLSGYGIKGDVFALPNSLIVSLTDENGCSHTRMLRTGYANRTDIESIEQYNALSRKICAEPPDPERLPELIDGTEKQCRRYPIPVLLLGYFVSAFFFTFFFGGGILEALVAGVAGTLAGFCVMRLNRLNVNFFFKTVAAAAALGAAAYLLYVLGMPINVDIAVIGGLMVLVPGLVFTNFMCDLIRGDALAGVSTFFRAILTATAIVVGIGISLSLFRLLGMPAEEIGTELSYLPILECVIGFFGCIGFCILNNIHGGSGILLCCLGGALGWGVHCAACAATDNIYLQYLAAAVTVAIFAEVMARLRKYPITAYLVVSFIPLVPGSAIYGTMYYAIQGNRELFLHYGLRTVEIAACLAIGSLLVSTVVRTFTDWRGERRRRRNGEI